MFIKILNVPVPARGSGAKGALVKYDLAKALAEHLFPGETESEIEKYVKGMGGQQRAIDPSILQILGELDPENAADKDFQKVKKIAMEEMQERLIRKGADHARAKDKEAAEKQETDRKKREAEEKEKAEKAEAERRKEVQKRNMGLTPKDLKDFLPGAEKK